MTSADPIGRALAVSVGVAGLFTSAVSAVGGATACRPAWSEMPTPQGANSFYGVAAITQSDVWAVGSHYDGVDDRAMAEHFDGIQWVIMNVPTPGASGAYLRGVGGVSGTDVWAAGYWITTSGLSNTLIEHYDGTSWTIVPSPNPPSSASYLGTVAAVATNDVWVAGHYLDNSGIYRTLVEHWDGTSWVIVSSPNAGSGDNALNGIAASASGDMFAAGYHYPNGTSDYQGLIEHYDGEQWRRVSSAQGASYTYLSGIAAQSGGEAWAVGNTLTATIAESVCEIQVSEGGFVPEAASGTLGDTVGWTITGSSSHRLVDASGMQLFDSGSRAPGSSLQFTFDSAGTYPVIDRPARATSVIAVPVDLPETGTTGVPLNVTWSAAPPSEGFLFDVQIRSPSDRGFRNWRVGQTDISATFVPPASGAYAFRARLRDSATGKFSKWSPSAVVTVANP